MNSYKKVEEFLESEGYLDLVRDDEKLENFIQNMTAEKFTDLMINVNKNLRNIEDDKQCLSAQMRVGDLVAPNVDIRDEIIENLVKSLKDLKDNKQRAALVYYTINNLHMFRDGNGRTSRMLFDLLTNELGEEVWYIHEDNKQAEYSGSFENYKGIEDITKINQFTSNYLGELIKSRLEKYPEISNKNYITAGSRTGKIFVNDVMSEIVRKELSEDELTKVENIMEDSFGSNYTISGLAMLTVANQKNELQEWIDYDNKCNEEYGDLFNGERFCLRAWSNPPMLKNWTAKDYKDVIEYGNYYKLQQFRILNDLFLNPEKYHKKDVPSNEEYQR